MPTMPTDGIGSRPINLTHVDDADGAPDSEVNVQESIGKAFQRSVQPREPDPRTAMPRSKGLRGISLGERKISSAHLQKEGFLTRLKSWLFKKPTANDQYVTGRLFNNLLASMESSMSSPGDSNQLFLNKGISVAPGSAGHKVCALMADMGLVRFVQPSILNEGAVQVEYIRPVNLGEQLKLTELLFESVPLELSAGNHLDWNAMTTKMPPQMLNNFIMSGALKNEGAGWKLASWTPEAARKLRHYASPTERTDLQEGMTYWGSRLQLLANELAEEHEQGSLMELGKLMNHYPERHTEIDELLTRTGQAQSLNQELQQCRDELAAFLKQDQQIEQRLI